MPVSTYDTLWEDRTQCALQICGYTLALQRALCPAPSPNHNFKVGTGTHMNVQNELVVRPVGGTKLIIDDQH